MHYPGLCLGDDRSAAIKAYRYDGKHGSWKSIADYPGKTAWGMALVYHGGKVYSLGGMGCNGSKPDFFSYDTSTNIWTDLGTMPTRGNEGVPDNEDRPLEESRHLGAVVMGDSIYAIGGKMSRRFDRYNIASGSWEMLPTMRASREFPCTAVFEGKIWVCCGRSGKYLARQMCDVYDPAANSWATKASPTQDIQKANMGVVGSKLYIVKYGMAWYYESSEDTLKEVVSGPNLAHLSPSERPIGHSTQSKCGMYIAWDDVRYEKPIKFAIDKFGVDNTWTKVGNQSNPAEFGNKFGIVALSE